MIDLYSGTPGSGKSLHMAEFCYYALKKGKPVIGTFYINEEITKKLKGKYTYVNIYDLDPVNLTKYAYRYQRNHKKKNPEGSMILMIDEAQRIFNSREWNGKGRNEWITFFAEHRHLGYDIILVSQMDRMLDRQIRGLIEYEYIHRKVANFGIFGQLVKLLFMGDMFVWVKNWYPMKERIDANFYRGTKKFYNFYDSYQLFAKTHGAE